MGHVASYVPPTPAARPDSIPNHHPDNLGRTRRTRRARRPRACDGDGVRGHAEDADQREEHPEHPEHREQQHAVSRSGDLLTEHDHGHGVEEDPLIDHPTRAVAMAAAGISRKRADADS